MASDSVVLLDELSKSFQVRCPRPRARFSRTLDVLAPRHARMQAVDRISFAISPGERVAFIGPNGAGKSTTLKVLTGILRPDAGRAEVLGLVPWQERRRLAFRIGTVFGQRSQLWYHLPARDTFALLAHVYEVPKEQHAQRLGRLVEAFRLGPLLDRPVRQLSLGERMRCELVASLLHSPELIFLDEPTIGLDVTAKAEVRALLQEQSRADGVTLLLTSHDTGDIERVCQRVLVIQGGRLLWDGSVLELRQRFLRTRIVNLWSECERLVFDLPGVRSTELGAQRYQIEVALERSSVGLVLDAALRQGALRDVAIEDPPLDDVIRALYEQAGSRAENGAAA